MPDRTAILHAANFGTSGANFATNFTTVALVDRGFGGVGLAAFQAMRSATNPIGVVSQVIDNHMCANLARSGRSVFGTGRIMPIALVVSFMLVLLTILIGPSAVELLFGAEFSGYWVLLPIMLVASLVHALTRPVFVTWRLSADTRALNLYSILLIAIALPTIALLGIGGWTLPMIVVFALLPLTAVIVDFWYRRSGRVLR